MAQSNENRQKLKDLSAELRPFVKSGQFDTMNEALVVYYESIGHKNLKTFRQWLREGKSVKKGEKALLLWGQPVSKKQEDGETDEYSFFPLCYVFSDSQIIIREGTRALVDIPTYPLNRYTI